VSWEPTTFAQLIEKQAPGLIVLAQVRAFERFDAWTLTDGKTKTYETPVTQYLNAHNVRVIDVVRMADPASDEDEPAYAAPSNAPVVSKIPSTMLVERESVDDVEAFEGSFFHDLTAGLLYVSMPDGETPAGRTIFAGFLLYFWPGGVTAGASFVDDEKNAYWPYLLSVPSITKGVGNQFFGVIQMGGGTLQLASATGALDAFLDRYTWDTGDVTVLLGGESLEFSEFARFPVGRTQDTEWDELVLTLSILDQANDLDIRFPRTVFTAADATKALVMFQGGDISNSISLRSPAQIAATTRLLIGQPKPTGYGRNEMVTPIPMAISTTESMWCLTHHPSFEIETVRALDEDVGTSGAGTRFLWFATEDLSVIKLEAIGDVDLSSVTPAVTFSGKMVESDGDDNLSLMDNFADIVEDLVLVECGLVTEFDEDILDRSRFRAIVYQPRIYISTETPLSSVLDNVMRSTLGYFYLTDAGLFCYDVWAPSVANERDLNDAWGDFLDTPRFKKTSARLYQAVAVEYGFNPQRSASAAASGSRAADGLGGNFLKVTATRAESVAVALDRANTFTIDATYQAEEGGAFILASRYARLCQQADNHCQVKSKIRPIQFDVMTRTTLTKARQPIGDGKAFHLEILKTDREFTTFTVAFDMDDQRVIGSQAFLAPDGSKEWSSMSVEERRTIGIFTDDNGFSDPAYSASFGGSRYW
jgi:hypothetical protein